MPDTKTDTNPLHGITVPDDAQDALEMHRELASSQKGTQAADAAATMRTRFKNHFEVQMYLGEYYENEGHKELADNCFARALKLNPSSNEARYAAAVGALEQGKPADARKLLSYMETPGPHQDFATINALACAYLDQKDYSNAYELFRVICRDFSQNARKDTKLRRDVLAVEKKLGFPGTILPKTAFRKHVGIYAGITGLVLAGIFFLDHYFRTHRTLYVVNNFPVRAEVIIPDMEPVSVNAYGLVSITVPAGKYRVTTKAGKHFSGDVAIDIGYDFFRRLEADNDVFILNVGGSAVLTWESTYYSAAPVAPIDTPYRLYPNRKFLALPNVDYVFKEFPKSIEVKQDTRVTKTRVAFLKGFPADIFQSLRYEGISPSEVMDYAEAHLSVTPMNTVLVQKYGELCFNAQAYRRGAAFLGKNISVLPAPIEWHRYYQILGAMAGQEKDIIAEYDAKIKEAPGNSDFLYLRGRLETGSRKSLEYYERSIKANPENPYPWFGKGYNLAALGKFPGARGALAAACRLKPDEKEWPEALFSIRMVLKEYDALEKEIAEQHKNQPLEYNPMERLFKLYVARGKTGSARQLKDRYLAGLKKNFQRYPGLYTELEKTLNMNLAYILRDFREVAKLARSLERKGVEKSIALFQAYIELADMEEAEEMLAAIQKGDTPGAGRPGYSDLLLWLGWKIMRADESKAGPWLESALDDFRRGAPEEKTIAGFLAKQEKNMLETVDHLLLPPMDKALICTALAVRYPGQRNALLKRAVKMNFNLEFPNHFLSQIIRRLQKKRS